MLTGLSIRDMALIERVDLSLPPGLTALTGETGAGKSILLDALGFALGWRGRGGTVRAGAAEGEVTAVFALGPDHPARAVLAEAGLPQGDELVLRRTLAGDGRSGAFVNDRRSSAETLRALSDHLVELHGQQDDKGLLNPRGHRQMLDEFAGHGTLQGAVRAAWSALSAARRDLAQAATARKAAAEDEEFLRFSVAELDKLSPLAGEAEALDAERRRLQAAARIGEEVARAAAAMGGQGAEPMLADALRRLDAAAARAEGRLDDAVAAAARALDALAEAGQAAERALEDLRFDPGALERAEERLFALRALARKHGVQPDDLPALALRLRARLEALDGAGRSSAALEAALRAAEAEYARHAQALTLGRSAAAVRLDAAMAAELVPLKLERARFITYLAPAEPGPEGSDEVTFTMSSDPGTPAGPLNRIASGGELSRFLLALKVCLRARADDLTMIFDEIDRGVGGATAAAVGRRLEALAGTGQVLVVTHSPQVAARAGQHFRVEKRTADGAARTAVMALGHAARIDELARMLAGDTVTEAAREAARALVAG